MFQWLNDRTGAVTAWKAFWYWTVPATKCIFRQLPIMIIFGFLLQGITGIVMWAHYSPSSQTAWESVFFFQYKIPMGWLIRGIHHYSAQLLVGILMFYVILAIFRRSYRKPREFVFWGSLVLLLIALCSCLTGDLMSWSLSGYSATLVRVRFLQMIPVIGDSLFKLVLGGPGPGFGTYTLTRFTVLHIMLFGGGFFLFLILWRFFDFRARKMEVALNAAQAAYDAEMGRQPEAKTCCCSSTKLTYFWSCQLLWSMFACLVFLAATLALVFQHDLTNTVNRDLPIEASRGASLMSPADPASSFDAARPEWSFRALYHFSNMFPANQKFTAIFIIPPIIALFFFAIPIIGKIGLGHWLNMAVTFVLLVAFLVMTYLSYQHDFKDPDFVAAVQDARNLSHRAVELALAPTGIPPTGALTLMQNDPNVQGPILFARHCATCHSFEPITEEDKIADFRPYKHAAEQDPNNAWRPTAPNLYNPIRAKWISGFLNKETLMSDHYFGNTAFKNEQMSKYLAETYPEFVATMKDEAMQELFKEEFELDSPEQGMDLIVQMLLDEAKRESPCGMKGNLPEGVDEKQYKILTEAGYGCFGTGCHAFYKAGKIGSAPDLTGYMSREWLFGAIANIADTKYYGNKNDKMPVYYVEGSDDSILTKHEVDLLTDWLRGTWYRPAPPIIVEETVENAETVVEKAAETAN